MKKINWKVRFKNKLWLGSFLSLIISFVFGMLKLFDVYPIITENQVLQYTNYLLTFLGLFGIIIDPTTEGFYDSERAMNYDEPWSDDDPDTEEHEDDPIGDLSEGTKE